MARQTNCGDRPSISWTAVGKTESPPESSATLLILNGFHVRERLTYHGVLVHVWVRRKLNEWLG